MHSSSFSVLKFPGPQFAGQLVLNHPVICTTFLLAKSAHSPSWPWGCVEASSDQACASSPALLITSKVFSHTSSSLPVAVHFTTASWTWRKTPSRKNANNLKPIASVGCCGSQSDGGCKQVMSCL